jgi:hypothetical protein
LLTRCLPQSLLLPTAAKRAAPALYCPSCKARLAR